MSLQHVVSKAPTELHVVVIWHNIRIMKFTKSSNLYKQMERFYPVNYSCKVM